jgi:hypothetical protein
MEQLLNNQQIPLVQVIDPNTGQQYYAPEATVYDDRNGPNPTRLKSVIVDQAVSASYFSGSADRAISASYALTASYALSSTVPSLQQVVNTGNSLVNFGGVGTASLLSVNFVNNRSLYLNNDAYPTIRLVDNNNASNNLQIDIDTISLDGTSYNWSDIVTDRDPFPYTGSAIITGSLSVIGTTTVTGDIIPSVSKSFSLGSTSFPFKDIYISSGSLVIASDDPEAPSTTLSNVEGNILISAGGMQLLGSGSFNAATGSFQYQTGSLNYVGEERFTGSLSILGSGTLNGCTILTTCQTGSFYTTSSFGFYGAFCSTASQTNPVGNISRSMQLETTEHSVGVSIVSGSRITVAHSGAYNLQFSAQLEKTNNGVDIVYIWFKKNGTNIPRSTTSIDVLKQAGGSGRFVAAWNYVDTFNAGDYIEIIWQSDDTNMQLAYDPAAGNFPSIPSVIATLTQIA